MDGHSRLVAFLKVALPLAALGLLSTLFLLSRSVDPMATIPFGEAEISERLREGVVTGPHFSGTTRGGEPIEITAASARPGSEGAFARAEDIRAEIGMSGGGRVTLSAATGSFDPDNDLARFDGMVEITTTTGYTLTTDAMESRIEELELHSDGPVEGSGPFGNITAGQMFISSDAQTNDAHLLFKNGVKLIYDPKAMKDKP